MGTQALIITDSLGAPRKTPLTYYKDTWVSQVEDYLFKKYNMKSFAYTQTGLTSQTALKQAATQLQYYEPKVVIIQLGIVDCTPRLVKYTSLETLEYFIPNSLKKSYNKLRKFLLVSPSLSALRKRHDVTPEEFISNLEVLFNNYFKESIIVFIPIGEPNKRYVFDSKYVKDHVDKYNKILSSFEGKRYFYLEEIAELVKNNIYKIYDKKNRHYLVEGHKIVADALIKQLECIAQKSLEFSVQGDSSIVYQQKREVINHVLANAISQKEIYIFGTGQYARALYKLISSYGDINVLAFVEKDKKMEQLYGLEVIEEEEFCTQKEQQRVVFIASSYEKEIYKRLKKSIRMKTTLLKVPSFFQQNNIKFNPMGYL